jgi:RND family efflux transporter MFP subunit
MSVIKALSRFLCYQLIILAPLLAACSGASGQGQRGGRPQAVTIEAVGAERITIQRRVDLTGTLTSPDEAKISSEVDGVVSQVAVELGQEVARGQVLVKLDPRELALELERAESALRQTEAQLGIDSRTSSDLPRDDDIASVRTATASYEDAKAQLARAEQLSTRGLVPVVERDAARVRVKITEAAYQSAIENVRSLKASLQDRRAAFELAKKKLDDTIIRAPVEGSVTERAVRPGTFIRENTPVVTLMKLDPLRLTASVQERFADIIRPGMAVQFQVESFRDITFDGRVAYVSPAIDHSTRTFTVEAEVANRDRRLRPGFFAKGAILTQIDQSVLAVPEDSISTLAGLSSVFVIEGGRVRQQQVVLGERQGKLFEIVDGLTGTEQLAGSNLNQLATDVAVTVRGAGSGDGSGEADSRESGGSKSQ